MMNSHDFWFRNHFGSKKVKQSQYIDPNFFVFKLLFTLELYLEKSSTLRAMFTIKRDRILIINNYFKTYLIYKKKAKRRLSKSMLTPLN
jgi:hypothetical protein